MKTLELRYGDLVIGSSGFATVDGPLKVRQDLGVMVREALGEDRFHPRWGTVLQQFVGRPAGAEMELLIKGELSRLLQNYMVAQTQQVEADMAAGQRPRYTPNELVASVGSIQVQQRYDRFNVRVTVRTLAGEDISILRTVDI